MPRDASEDFHFIFIYLNCWGLTGEVSGSLSAFKVLGVYSVLMDKGGISFSSSGPLVVRQQASAE